jgi:hypothetical protein
VSRIATEANVSKGLMYNYFSQVRKMHCSEELLTDALEQAESEFAWPAEASPKEQLRVTIDYVFFALRTAQNDASIVDGFNDSNARIRVYTRYRLGKTESVQISVSPISLIACKGMTIPEREALNSIGHLRRHISLQYMVLDSDYDLNAIKNVID